MPMIKIRFEPPLLEEAAAVVLDATVGVAVGVVGGVTTGVGVGVGAGAGVV